MSVRYVAVPLILLGISLAPGLSAAARPEPKIVEIHGHVKGEQAFVRFQIRHAFTPEMVEALKSGIEISFRTQVEVERVHRNWFNVIVGDLTISRSVRYDALSRVYRLKRSDGEKLLPDIFSALDGMSRYEIVVPLRYAAVPGRRYRALVRTRLDRVGLSEPLRSVLFFSSIWDVETRWGKGNLTSP
jgi:Domain of unknown function (DUF4390)